MHKMKTNFLSVEGTKWIRKVCPQQTVYQLKLWSVVEPCAKSKAPFLCQLLIPMIQFPLLLSSTSFISSWDFPCRIFCCFLMLQLISILSNSWEEKVGEMNESLGYQRRKSGRDEWISQLSIKSFLDTGKYRRDVREAVWNFSLCIHLLFQQATLVWVGSAGRNQQRLLSYVGL